MYAISHKAKRNTVRILITVLMGVFCIAMLVPFAWMLSASFKRPLDVMELPIRWIPEYFYPDNIINVWNIGGVSRINYQFDTAYLNSIKISTICMLGAVLSSSLAGYAFAKIPFKGANLVFVFYLATMMIPSQVTLVPRFVIFSALNMTGSHWPLILPGLINVTGTFMMRQAYTQIPNEMRESAFIDGASEIRIWWQIIMPMARASMAALAMVVFLFTWKDYLDPLVFLSKRSLYTIPVSLNNFIQESTTEYNLIMAASASALLPVFVVFLCGQKFFVKGLTAGAVKG